MGCLQSKSEVEPPRGATSSTSPPQPLFAAPDANGSIAKADAESTPRSPPKKQRSALKRDGTPRKDDDEESDWDQCSNSADDVDNTVDNAHAPKEEDKTPDDENEASSSKQPVEKATAQATYKETTTLRIDKVKGCMFVNQYLVVKFLGRGACGKVFLCLNTHDLRLCAMKAVRKTDLEAQAPPPPAGGSAPPKPRRNPMEDLKREIMIMRKMKHANIVTLSEVIDDPSGSKLLLIMEYLDGGPVLTREALEKREKLPESLALRYFRDMVKALDYLHAHKVVHGDLKPENVLMMASGSVKLSDFGCSKLIATTNEYLDRCNGTPAFLAPEMMKPNTRYRGRPTDVYALGACLFTLLFGRIPFSAPNLYKLFQTVQNDPVKFPEDVVISPELKDLLNLMLIKNPRERITLPEIMSHPWTSMSGRFPLKPVKDLTTGETQEEHDHLADPKVDFALGNPRPNALAGLLNLSRHERTFNVGDIVMRQGENATYMLYIVSGTVDIIVKWALPPMKRNSQLMIKPGEPPSTAPTASQDEFMDESEAMSPIADPESRKNRTKLQRASTKARDFILKLQAAANALPSPAPAPSSPPPSNIRSLLIAQRGPGDLIGDMGLFSKVRHRHATVKCTSAVVARVILPDQLEDYMANTPLAKSQLREAILLKESEISMVEALTKLSNAHETITASLVDQASPSAPATPASPPTPPGEHN